MGIMDLFNKKEKDADEISVKEQMKQDASARENIEIEVSGTEKYRKEAQIRHIQLHVWLLFAYWPIFSTL